MTVGFDKYSLNIQCQLALLAGEYTGAKTYDKSKNHLPFTLSGAPGWAKTAQGLPYLSFGGIADFLQSPAAGSTALNFTATDYSIAMWFYPTVASSDILIQQGKTDVDGWVLYATEVVNTISLRHNQAGTHTDIAAVGAYTPSVWQCLLVTRSGASGQVYINGAAKSMTFGAGLTNPVSVAGGNKVLVGVDDLEANNFYSGYIAGGDCGIRIWNRALTATEANRIFVSERHWFGV
jgi:hypothetical protein